MGVNKSKKEFPICLALIKVSLQQKCDFKPEHGKLEDKD